MGRAAALIELARPAQWIKNGFVLLPLFFAHALLSPLALRGALLATAAFCLASSAVYAFNDVRDVARDRLHQLAGRLQPELQVLRHGQAETNA